MLFDTKKAEAVIGIWFIGNAMSCYIAYMVFTFLGSLDDLAAALYFAIAGGICVVLGLVFLFLSRYEGSEGVETSGEKWARYFIPITVIGMAICMIMATINPFA